MIIVRNLSMVYGARGVLADVSFDGRPGTITSIVGRTGCGKSTLLQILAGLRTPSFGSFQCGPHVTYVSQRIALLPWRTAFNNMAIPLEVHGQLTDGNVTRLRALAHEYGIGDAMGLRPDQLSGGMRQIVAILRAFVSPASVLLLDEPFTAIDYPLRIKLEDALVRHSRDTNAATLLVTHDLEEALAVSDRIVVLAERPARVVENCEVAFFRAADSSLGARATSGFVPRLARLLALLKS